MLSSVSLRSKSHDLTIVNKDQSKGKLGPGELDSGVYILDDFRTITVLVSVLV